MIEDRTADVTYWGLTPPEKLRYYGRLSEYYLRLSRHHGELAEQYGRKAQRASRISIIFAVAALVLLAVSAVIW